MELTGREGSRLELTLLGYQFQGARVMDDSDGWDRNWLRVHGRARNIDGRQWTFLDPCLTTWDARDLSAWLYDAASGATEADPNDAPSHRLAFTEPNLAFGLTRDDGRNITIQVHLAHESAPPWLEFDERVAEDGYVLALTSQSRRSHPRS